MHNYAVNKNWEYKFTIKLNGLIGIFLSFGILLIKSSNVNIARKGDKAGKATAGNVIRN